MQAGTCRSVVLCSSRAAPARCYPTGPPLSCAAMLAAFSDHWTWDDHAPSALASPKTCHEVISTSATGSLMCPAPSRAPIAMCAAADHPSLFPRPQAQTLVKSRQLSPRPAGPFLRLCHNAGRTDSSAENSHGSHACGRDTNLLARSFAIRGDGSSAPSSNGPELRDESRRRRMCKTSLIIG